MKQAIICDIDGTLAVRGDRSPFDWKKVGEDTINPAVANVLEHYKLIEIIILSGRDSICRPETEEWLKRYNISYNQLHMREIGDIRKDTIVKEELYKNNIKNKFEVLFVLDDRDQVVALWRSLGLACFQVNYGNF